MTQFLRFPDESAWLAAAAEAGFYSEPVRARNDDGTFTADDPSPPVNEAWTGTLAAYTHDRAIDVVGEIVDMAGFHVNFAGELPDGWDGFVVSPASPYRVFA